MTYYNTVSEQGETLKAYRSKASGQDAKILELFRKRPEMSYSPFQVLAFADLPVTTPITSVRRSMSNLTKAGLLVRLDAKRKGNFGRNNCTWKLNTQTI